MEMTRRGVKIERVYECKDCDKAFTREEHLKRHAKSHSDEPVHRCAHPIILEVCSWGCVRPFAGATLCTFADPVADCFLESVPVELAFSFLSCFLHPKVGRGDSVVCSLKNSTLQFLRDDKL